MKSLQSLYEFEREELITYEHDKYFFTYKVVGNEFHIFDVFIHPDHRNSDVSSSMIDKIHWEADKLKCDFLVGYINKGAKGNSRSLAYQLKHGMEIHSWDNERIVLIKRLKDG